MKSRVIGLDETWMSPDPVYAHDDSIFFKNLKTQYTAGEIDLKTSDILTNVVDQSTNQFSNLYLTDNRKISDFIGMRTPTSSYPYTYITYFAATYGWTDRLSPSAKCWYVKDTTDTQELMVNQGIKPTFGFDRRYDELSNEMLFEVELLTDNLLRVSHWDTYKRSYLTVTPDGDQVLFDFENNLELDESNPQVFNYNLDRESSYMNLYVVRDGVYYELAYDLINNRMVLGDTSADDYIPTTYKNAKIQQPMTEIPVVDNWVSYTTGINQNNLEIDLSRSYSDISHNFLLNTEYVYDDNGGKTQFNVLPLKNHMTNHLQLSRNNPFPAEQPTFFREYSSINTGTNQTYGYDNIYLNYSDYTELLTFPSDKITYFHTPPDMYPYKQLNISDAGLVESGAIAGDQPVRSDKVFKKRANYGNAGSWGDAQDEQSGEFLCAWLYWSGKENEKPIWLDRYYNPRRYTIAQALSVRPIVQFISTFDNMVLDNPGVEDYAVFDKVSDLCFEPEVLYCYHRLGASDIKYSINRLQSQLVQQGFDVYRNKLGSSPEAVLDDDNAIVYNFTNENYAETSVLNGISETNAFSLTYSMYADDWSKKFGHQIMGNYTNDGFAVLNNRFITPTLTVPGSAQRVVNTDLVTTVTINRPAVYTFQSPVSESLYVYNHTLDGKLYEYDLNGILLEVTHAAIYPKKRDLPPYKPTLVTYDLSNMYIVYDDTSYVTVDLMTEKITNNTFGMERLPSLVGGSINKPTAARAVDGVLYVTDVDYIDVDSNNVLWWLKHNKIHRYDTINKQLTEYFTSTDYIIKDVKLDVDDNMYVLYRLHAPVVTFEPGDNTYSYHYDYSMLKLSPSRDLLYNVSLSTIQPHVSSLEPDAVVNVNLVSEYASTGHEHYWMLISPSLSTYTEVVSGEDVERVLDLTDVTKINLHDGTGLSTNSFVGDVSQFAHADSNYCTTKQQYRQDMLTNNLTYRLKLNNTYDTDMYEIFDCTVDVSTLDPGWHQFSYDYASHLGKILLFIDGELITSLDVTPDKYRFSDINIQSIKVGPSTHLNGVWFNNYLKQPGYYISNNYKIKNFYIYNDSLNYYDLKFFYRQLGTVRDLKWTLPANSRNYIDEIQQTFKHQRSPIKSNNYNIEILCDAIKDPNLKADLTADIKLKLTDQIPVNVKTTDVKWYDTSNE